MSLRASVVSICLWGFAGLCLAASPSALATPLDDYIAKPDPAFSYDTTPAKEVNEGTYTARTYHMVSQEWLDSSKIDRTKWEHWVVVVTPKEVSYENALLIISGGSNRPGDPPTAQSVLGQIAVMTKSVLVEVKQIPNQPFHFPDETDERYKERGRSEDEFIAYGWDKFLVTQDPLWLPRLPMTKAIVRGMDLAQKENPNIKGFFVCGASKRGWTTWTTAAADKRVIGIAPCVIDVLNVAKSLENHQAAYGFWAPAVGDYVDMKITDRVLTPEFKALEAVVDPYSYLDRLTMPKYIMNAAGDQFFPPDSWKFYFNDLKGEKHLRYIPNVDHGMSPEAYFNMASFYSAVLTNTPRPKYSWSKAEDGNLELRCETKPAKVLLWQATNPEARDFRLEKIGKAYTSSDAVEVEPGVYRTSIKAPEKGWTAFLLEVEFPNPSFPSPFKFTTGISILPDTYPAAK